MTLIAIIVMPDGKFRQACVDCCEALEAAGMLDREADDGASAIFKINKNHTLEECKAFIGERKHR